MRAVPEEEEDEERASPTTIITIATTAQAPTVDNCECKFLLWQENAVNADTSTIFDTTTDFINGDAMFHDNCQ